MLQPSIPVTNPELVKALEELHKENTPVNQNRVLDEVLMRAHFLAPVVLNKENREKKGDIQFRMISSKDGHPFFPAFTDLEQLQKLPGPKEQQSIILTFDDFAKLLETDSRVAGFVVNPLGKPLTLDRNIVAQLAKEKQARAGYAPNPIDPNAEIQLWDTDDMPQDMLDAISSAVEPLQEVKRLFVRLMGREGQERPSYLIVVDHSGDMKTVFHAIADAARPHLNGRMVEMALYNSKLGQMASEDIEPFFERK